MAQSDGGPAFPGGRSWYDPDLGDYRSEQPDNPGMSLRDYAEIHFTAAWIQVLGARHKEAGYSDDSVTTYALNYGKEAAEHWLGLRGKGESDGQG